MGWQRSDIGVGGQIQADASDGLGVKDVGARLFHPDPDPDP